MLSFIRNANHPAPCMQSGMIFHVIFCQQAFSRRASEWFYKAPQSRQPLLCFPVRQHFGRCIPLHTQPDFEGINHVQMRYLIVFCCFSYVFTPAFIIPAKALIKQHRYIFFKGRCQEYRRRFHAVQQYALRFCQALLRQGAADGYNSTPLNNCMHLLSRRQ